MVDTINSYMQYSPSFTGANTGFYNGLKGAAVANNSEIRNMARYLTGQTVAETPAETTLGQDLKMTLPMLGIFGSLQAFPWLKSNNFVSKVKGFPWVNFSVKEPLEKIRAEKAAFLAVPENSRFNVAKNAGSVLSEKQNLLFKKLTDADKTALMKDRSFLGKMLDVIPGYKKLRTTGFGQMMGKSGAGWMIAMDGAVKIFSDIIPTFKELGAGAGVKQIAKSGTQIVSSAAGWTIGEIAGSAIGAAIGTAICPGVGTAIGKFVGGFLAGTTGMWLANKGAKAITGKNELEKVKEEETAKLEQEAVQNPESQLALANAALEQANAVLAQDPQNQEALAMKESAEKMIASLNTDNKTQDTEQNQTAPAQTQNQASTQYPNLSVPPVPGFNGAGYDMNTYTSGISSASSVTNPFSNPYLYQQKQQAQQTQPAQ